MADVHASTSVAVVGGGPAGAMTALILARAGVDVLLFDRGARHSERGEVLAPEGRAVLGRVGLWERRPSGTFGPCESSRIAWRSPRLVERTSITDPYGCGWRVHRPAFDEWLLSEAASCGARVSRETAVTHIDWQEELWRLSLRGARRAAVGARVLVDATGRSLLRSHWSGTARSRADTLCAVLGRGPCAGSWRDLLVEACPDGWCYSIGIGEDAVVGFVTDADVLAGMGRGCRVLESALQASPLTAAQIRALTGEVRTVSIATTWLEQAAGEAWLAVGDAALAHDPLAGQGLLFALRSAQDAAHAIAGRLAGDVDAVPRYATTMRARVLAYLADRRDVYSAQPRWQDRPFWRRRSGLTFGAARGEMHEQAG